MADLDTLDKRIYRLAQRTLLTLAEGSKGDPNLFFDRFFAALEENSKLTGLTFSFLVTDHEGEILTNAIFLPDRERTPRLELLLARIGASTSGDSIAEHLKKPESLYHLAIKHGGPFLCSREAEDSDGAAREVKVTARWTTNEGSEEETQARLYIPPTFGTGTEEGEKLKEDRLREFIFSASSFPLYHGVGGLNVFIHATRADRPVQDFTDLASFIGSVFANELVDFMARGAFSIETRGLGDLFRLWHWTSYLKKALESSEEQVFVGAVGALREETSVSAEIVIRDLVWALHSDPSVDPAPSFDLMQRSGVLDGAEVSRVIQEVQHYRALDSSPEPIPTTTGCQFICVFSSRGGVGKTSLSWKLAQVLKGSGDVCVLEGDVIEPSFRALMPNIGDGNGKGVGELLEWLTDQRNRDGRGDGDVAERVSDAIVEYGGVSLLVARSQRTSKRWFNLMGAVTFGQLRPAFETLFKEVQTSFQYVIVDCPAQIRELSVAAMLALPEGATIIQVASTFEASLEAVQIGLVHEILREGDRTDLLPTVLAMNRLRPLEQIHFRVPSSARSYLSERLEGAGPAIGEIVGIPWAEELERRPWEERPYNPEVDRTIRRLAWAATGRSRG